MKKRSGFVSNSSTSSFIVKSDPSDDPRIKEILDRHKFRYTCEADFSVEPLTQQYLEEELKDLFDEKGLEELKEFIGDEPAWIIYSDWHCAELSDFIASVPNIYVPD